MSTLDRFLKYVDKTGECWIWTGGTSTSMAGGKKYQYGMFLFDGKVTNAHRVAVLLAGGDIPPKHHVHHLCENTLCVRPDHLEVLTPKAHAWKGSHRTALATHCKRGHPYGDLRDSRGRRRCWVCFRAANKANAQKYGKAYFAAATRRYRERQKFD